MRSNTQARSTGNQREREGASHQQNVRAYSRRSPAKVKLTETELRQYMLGGPLPEAYGDQPLRHPQTRVRGGGGARQTFPVVSPTGGQIHRASGMDDLSNLSDFHTGTACAEYRSSIINIYEEFQKQMEATEKAYKEAKQNTEIRGKGQYDYKYIHCSFVCVICSIDLFIVCKL